MKYRDKFDDLGTHGKVILSPMKFMILFDMMTCITGICSPTKWRPIPESYDLHRHRRKNPHISCRHGNEYLDFKEEGDS